MIRWIGHPIANGTSRATGLIDDWNPRQGTQRRMAQAVGFPWEPDRRWKLPTNDRM